MDGRVERVEGKDSRVERVDRVEGDGLEVSVVGKLVSSR